VEREKRQSCEVRTREFGEEGEILIRRLVERLAEIKVSPLQIPRRFLS